MDEIFGGIDLDDEIVEDSGEFDELADDYDAEFIDSLVTGILKFAEALAGLEMYDYQRQISRRIIESVLINDGAEITALISRQAGKSETVANTISSLMVLLPKLAAAFPDLLGHFNRGFYVGVFAPVESQADIVFGRVVDRLTSERSLDILMDPEIDERPEGRGKIIKLRNGSLARQQTANPRAKIEGRTYHMILIDEAQDADQFTVEKSIHPMLASTNGTMCKIGTPATTKGDFLRAIQHNKREQVKPRRKQNHFEFNWKACAKHNPRYAKYVRGEMDRYGEDSDTFQMSYNLKWLLERGMFVTESVLDDLSIPNMQIIHAHHSTPVVIGIDPARSQDSTVVTVVAVDWDRPDEFGYYYHWVLNWLEMHGDDWEEQYFRIVDFIANYNVLAIAVDSQGVGDAVAQRLAILMPHIQVHALLSSRPAQSERWKHLMQLIQRRRVVWPGHSKTRRLKVWRRFRQQMEDLEKKYEGPHLLAMAPDEKDAHDDYPDSLALACCLTKDLSMPEAESGMSPFALHRTR